MVIIVIIKNFHIFIEELVNQNYVTGQEIRLSYRLYFCYEDRSDL